MNPNERGSPSPRRRQVVSLVALLALGVSAGAAPEGGKLYRERGCVACHGADGSHPVSPDYPVIAGQSPSYLLRQMRDIRDGARTNGLAAVMRATVSEVSDAEFAAIAQWLAQKF